jgi:hypothetical protein
MNTLELRAFLATRIEGPWELLATSMGVGASVEKTKSALSARALADASLGEAISPPIIDCRVQALAAFDTALLAEVASGWPSVDELRDRDPVGSAVDFWATAWTSSLRFLPAFRGQFARDPRGLPLHLQKEADILVRTIPRQGLADSIARAREASVTYEDLRVIARHTDHDEEVTQTHLEALLGQHTSPAVFERLRVVAHPDARFSAAAVDRLEHLFREYWLGQDEQRELGGGLMLTEVTFQQSVNEELRSSAARELVGRLERGGPREWARTAYLMSGTRWTCP